MKRQKAVDVFTSLAGAKLLTVLIGFLGIAILNTRLKAQSVPQNEAGVSSSDLNGLWLVLDPRNPAAIVNYLDVVQSGNAVTLRMLRDGKPPLVVFEGSHGTGNALVGKWRDLSSPEDKPNWVPLQIAVTDATHLTVGPGVVFTRATKPQAAHYKQVAKLALVSLPEKPFNLNGLWMFVDTRANVRQVGDQLTMISTDTNPVVFFRATYTSNPVIMAEVWGKGSTRENPIWVPKKLTVLSPDHIMYGNEIIYRLSPPPPHDVACDAQNTYHIMDVFAYTRGTQAAEEKDYKTARCWYTIASDSEYPIAQSTLASLILDGSDGTPPDQSLAFNLMLRSAQNGDPTGEYWVANMYHFGRGTPVDSAKADYWMAKAKESAYQAMQRRPNPAITPGMAENLGKALDFIKDNTDFTFPVGGQSCFSVVALGNKRCTN